MRNLQSRQQTMNIPPQNMGLGADMIPPTSGMGNQYSVPVGGQVRTQPSPPPNFTSGQNVRPPEKNSMSPNDMTNVIDIFARSNDPKSLKQAGTMLAGLQDRQTRGMPLPPRPERANVNDPNTRPPSKPGEVGGMGVSPYNAY